MPFQNLFKKQKFQIVAFLFLIVLIVAGFVIMAIRLKNGSNQPLLPVSAIVASDQIKGDREAKIILIEYSDFQCPACAAYAPIVKQIAEEFKDSAVFVYRHFPLSQHKNAELAALAAEAAGKQGKFWEMHDLIFENQNEWSESQIAEELFVKYATELNINIGQFKNDLISKEIKDKVKNDLRSGEKNGVNSTPTFFLNNKKIQPRSYDEFKQLIEASKS